MHEALSPPPGQHTARAIVDVCIDYQQLITTPAARWLQNNNLLVSTLVTNGKHRLERQALGKLENHPPHEPLL